MENEGDDGDAARKDTAEGPGAQPSSAGISHAGGFLPPLNQRSTRAHNLSPPDYSATAGLLGKDAQTRAWITQLQ